MSDQLVAETDTHTAHNENNRRLSISSPKPNQRSQQLKGLKPTSNNRVQIERMLASQNDFASLSLAY
jgi:hypothetical protein